jgi:hypothetical protein
MDVEGNINVDLNQGPGDEGEFEFWKKKEKEEKLMKGILLDTSMMNKNADLGGV